jgi:hypothetical protein
MKFLNSKTHFQTHVIISVFPQAAITPSEANETPGGKADFTETLVYIADPNHNGQELRCVLEHMGYSLAQLEESDNIATQTLELLCKNSF